MNQKNIKWTEFERSREGKGSQGTQGGHDCIGQQMGINWKWQELNKQSPGGITAAGLNENDLDDACELAYYVIRVLPIG